VPEIKSIIYQLIKSLVHTKVVIPGTSGLMSARNLAQTAEKEGKEWGKKVPGETLLRMARAFPAEGIKSR
jgi:hypothetical protein